MEEAFAFDLIPGTCCDCRHRIINRSNTMPPQTRMDTLVLDALKLVQRCTESVETVSTGASAARKAATSAKTFLEEGEHELSAARMRRCEKILSATRDSAADLDNHMKRLSDAVATAASQPASVPGSWNRLSDTWWLEKANRLQELLKEVSEKRGELYSSWSPDGPNIQFSDSYVQVVVGIFVAAEGLKRSWKCLVEYIEEWEETARVVRAGIGESASLLPS